MANRALLQRKLQVDGVQWLQQEHTSRAIVVDAVSSTAPCADALYTRVPGIALAVLTADCLPVLLSSSDGSEIAVAHAGWRGLANGILPNTLACFTQPAASILAWMGPAIGPRHFEVGAEVRQAFLDSSAFISESQTLAAFMPSTRPGHYYCDLYALARLCLESAGVRHIYGGGYCTFAEPQRFYSYRRQPTCGRMATIIVRK
jgi:hypothetical protein